MTLELEFYSLELPIYMYNIRGSAVKENSMEAHGCHN